jgi:predicted alpha-1,2-mannosidase
MKMMKMKRRNFIKSSLAAGAALAVPDLLTELAVAADAESQTHPLRRETPAREAAKSVTPVDYVDPFVGSQGSRWFVFTPAALPFGLCKLAPMTYGFNGYYGGGGRSGYNYRDTSILGFAHVHEWQAGGILTMPTIGPLTTVPGDATSPSGFRSPFQKANEKGSAGYYSVLLDKYNIRAELTATTRVGLHRYTFPASDDAHIIFDTGHLLGEAGSYSWGGPESKQVMGAGIEILSPTELQGYTIAVPAYQTYRPDLGKESIRVYFASVLSKPALSYGCYRDNTHNDRSRAEYGQGCGAYLNFKTANNEAIEIKVAVSYVSMEQAWANLKAESAGKTFDQVREEARKTWNTQLSKIEVEGGTEENKTKFYSALYRALLGRGISSDANGKYISNLNEVKQIPLKGGVPEYNHYNNDALWGSFTELIQLWSLVYPEQVNSYVKCMLDIYDDAGWLPDGVTCDKFMPGMESNETCTMIGAAISRGIATFDMEEAYQACLKSETDYHGRPPGVGKDDLSYFWEKGYVPTDKYPRAAGSHTLEYSYTCWVTAQIAERLHKTADYERLMQGSRNWQNIFDEESGFFNARNSDGAFQRPFNSSNRSNGFEEGSILQYAFYVPHDPEGIINKMGKERSIQVLNDGLASAAPKNFMSTAYNQGNEPSLMNVYFFDHMGRPDLAQKWLRAIMDTFYTSAPSGYRGQDDDQGQLSSWFVLAAIGLYDVSGGSGVNQQLSVHTPLFPRITIHLNRDYYKSDKFTIVSNNFSDKSIYIKSATLNGALVKDLRFDFAKVNANPRLELELSENTAQ